MVQKSLKPLNNDAFYRYNQYDGMYMSLVFYIMVLL